MKKLKKILDDEDNSVSKAALYYLICQLLIKGVTFITTPIFARLLTKSEFGDVNNFFAWQAILLPLITLDLRVTINKARYDFERDNDSYLTSILLTSNIITMIMLLIVELNRILFENIFSMSIIYIRIMLIYIIFQTAFDYQQIQYNIFHKYKRFVFYTVLSTVSSVLLSVVLVLFMKDRYAGRVFGMVIPAVIVDLIIYINILNRSNKFQLSYVKYAVFMAIPLIPSALSSTILSTSDRAMITQICGSEQTALYSIAYSVSSIAGILWSALNQAWGPWLYDKFQEKRYVEIKKISKKFALLYAGLIIGIMLIAPEIVYVMGGKVYIEAIGVMPPVILSMVFQFFYSFYFNTEYFYGETYVISIGTTIAALINFGLNYIFIPKYGYIAAAYTTLVGYAIMYVYHYLIVKIKLKKSFMFDNQFHALVIAVLAIVQLLISFIYNEIIIRYLVIGIYIILFIFICIKNKQIIIRFIKKVRKEDK